MLEEVTLPSSGVASFARPRHWERNREVRNRFQASDNVAWSPEFDAFLSSVDRKSLEEFEDTAFARHHFAECLVVHADVDNLFFLRKVGNPAHVLVGGQWVRFPFGVVEASGDVFGELAVA